MVLAGMGKSVMKGVGAGSRKIKGCTSLKG